MWCVSYVAPNYMQISTPSIKVLIHAKGLFLRGLVYLKNKTST
jgi:hypothetical protein